MSLEDENTSDFERQNTIGKPMSSTPALEENDVTHKKNDEARTSAGSFGRTQPPEYQLHAWGMPLPLSGPDGVVSGAREPLPDMGRGGSSVNRVTRSSTEGRPPGSEFNTGAAMDGGKRFEISGVERTDSGFDARY